MTAELPTARELAAALPLDQIARAETSFLYRVEERARAKVVAYTPMTVESRLESFRATGFKPYGLFLPNDYDNREIILAAQKRIGADPDIDARLRAYHLLQDKTAALAHCGVAGEWTGQLAVAHSAAQFRVVAWGRRGGKTSYAAQEAVSILLSRPRSTVWVAAPTSRLVSRCFDLVLQALRDHRAKFESVRNTKEDKLLLLENGARCEGISLDNVMTAAEASVDLAIVDEAGFLGSDAWWRAILPPLADRGGQALVISSYQGGEGFFYDLVEKFRQDINFTGDAEVFIGESWHNFYAFPQGRDSPMISLYERLMPATEFLEEFGSVPMAPRDRIYPQFKESVHVGDFPYDPDLPVTLCCDPSSGAAPYAVVALQNPSEDVTYAIDEYYVEGVNAEDVARAIDRKPYRSRVEQMVMDSASPNEIERWVNMGYPAFGVPDKPRPEQRIPYYRRLLRDPRLFFRFHQDKLNRILTQSGMSHADYLALEGEAQRRFLLDVEESLADNNLTPQDIEDLQACSHLFFDRKCFYTINEHRTYSYLRPVKKNMNLLDKPRKYRDHSMDALGYWAWTFKRFEPLDYDVEPSTSYLDTAPREPIRTPLSILDQHDVLDEDYDPRPRPTFLQTMREQYRSRGPMQPYSMLGPG